MNNFCETLRERRKSVGLSQEKLADAVGVHRRTIENIERGHTFRPRKYTVETIEAVLKAREKEVEEFGL